MIVWWLSRIFYREYFGENDFGVCKFLGGTCFGKIFTEEFCSMVRTGTIVSGSGDDGHPKRLGLGKD